MRKLWESIFYPNLSVGGAAQPIKVHQLACYSVCAKGTELFIRHSIIIWFMSFEHQAFMFLLLHRSKLQASPDHHHEPSPGYQLVRWCTLCRPWLRSSVGDACMLPLVAVVTAGDSHQPNIEHHSSKHWHEVNIRVWRRCKYLYKLLTYNIAASQVQVWVQWAGSVLSHDNFSWEDSFPG